MGTIAPSWRQTDRPLCGRHLIPSAQTAGFLTYCVSPAGPRLLVSLHNGVCGRLPLTVTGSFGICTRFFYRPGGRHCPCYQVVERHTTPIFPLCRAGRTPPSKSIRAASARGMRPMPAAGGPGGASSSVMPFRAISCSWPAPPPAPLGSAGVAGGPGPAQPEAALHRGEQRACLRGRRGGGVQALRHQLQQAAGASSSTVQKPGVPRPALRRPIRELIAAHHGGERCRDQALDPVRGAAEQAGGRPGAPPAAFESPAVFSPSKAMTTVSTGL